MAKEREALVVAAVVILGAELGPATVRCVKRNVSIWTGKRIYHVLDQEYRDDTRGQLLETRAVVLHRRVLSRSSAMRSRSCFRRGPAPLDGGRGMLVQSQPGTRRKERPSFFGNRWHRLFGGVEAGRDPLGRKTQTDTLEQKQRRQSTMMHRRFYGHANEVGGKGLA